jgi:uncharacterized protein YihD (DUF1040 family)
MCDPKRIDKVLGLIRKYWSQNPDLRLTQLMTNLFFHNGKDFYYLEDEEIIKKLNEHLRSKVP